MAISSIYHHERCILRIDGSLTIYEAGEAKRRLMEELNLAREVEVDLAGLITRNGDLANPLTVLAPLLCGLTRTGGRIALSGILSAQTEMVRNAYRPAFELQVSGERDGWVLLTGIRV